MVIPISRNIRQCNEITIPNTIANKIGFGSKIRIKQQICIFRKIII